MTDEAFNPVWRLTDPYSGALERDLPLGGWAVPPGLKLEGGYLVYERRPFLPQDEPVIAQVRKNILFDFSELAETDDSRVLDYAQMFGVLGLCEHGNPLGHITGVPIEGVCVPDGWPGVECREPIEKWHFFSRGFRAVLRLSVALHEGKNGGADDWKDALSLPRIAAGRGEGPWDYLFGIVNHLMGMAAMRPYCTLKANKIMSVELRATNLNSVLFATLVTELLFTVTKSKGLLVCSDCGRFFLPKNPGRTGARRFCPSCGLKAAWRSASTDYRRRRKDEEIAAGQKNVPLSDTTAEKVKPAKSRSHRKCPIAPALKFKK